MPTLLIRALRAYSVLLFILVFVTPATGQEKTPAAGEEDIDVFMAKVLERRETNWDQLYDYVFNEREILEIKGDIDIPALQSFVKEWRWFVRDGYLVRSPVSHNGIRIPDEERIKSENNWIEDYKKRRKEEGSTDREQFFGFDFEPGNYFYAGRTTIDGRELAIVEYYPDIKITGEPPEDEDDEYDDMVEKSMMVTLYIYPEDHQVVRMTLHNTGFDFLPGRWLVRVTGIEATMKMEKPLGDAWMPVDIFGQATMTMASGDISVSFRKQFYDYRRAKVKVRFRFAPRGSDQDKSDEEK